MRTMQGTKGGDMLARWLTKTKTTQLAFARRLGVTQGGVSALLSGTRVPNAERRAAIMLLTGISIAAWDRAGATREVRVRA